MWYEEYMRKILLDDRTRILVKKLAPPFLDWVHSNKCYKIFHFWKVMLKSKFPEGLTEEIYRKFLEIESAQVPVIARDVRQCYKDLTDKFPANPR